MYENTTARVYLPELLDTNNVTDLWDFIKYYNLTHIYPHANYSIGANITLFPNVSVQLNFIDPGPDFAFMLPLLSQLIDPHITRGFVTCAYPLSGQYDHLARSLFYTACVVAMVLRKVTWVAEAALDIIIAYSSISAIHLFVLLGFYEFGHGMQFTVVNGVQLSISQPNPDSTQTYGDPDFLGIAPVIAVCVVVLTPMLSWSSTFRSNRHKIILQCWSLFMFVAFIPVLVYMSRYKYEWSLDKLRTMAYCTDTSLSCQPGEDDLGMFGFVFRDQYKRCNCNDFCGVLSPNAPLRGGTSMVPVLYYRFTESLYNPKHQIMVLRLQKGAFGLLIFALVQGFLALMHSHSTPISVRNTIFRFCNSNLLDLISWLFRGQRRNQMIKRLSLKNERKRSSIYRKLRLIVAVIISASYYLLCMLGAVVYPILFAMIIAVAEIFLSLVPNSEHSSALGAWGPWAGAGLIVLAAIILALYPFVVKLWESATAMVQYSSDDRPHRKERKRSLSAPIWSGIHKLFTHSKEYLSFSRWKLWWHIKFRSREFWIWLRDPEVHSHRDPSNLSKDTDLEDLLRVYNEPVELQYFALS
jgi:hypothetical protein